MRLDRADYYVLTALAPPSGFVQHPKRFSHPGSIAEEDLQPPFDGRGFLGLTFAKEFVGSLAAKLDHDSPCPNSRYLGPKNATNPRVSVS